MRTYSRYADQYLKKKHQQDPTASKSRLISQINESSPDPYQQFLEVQLEKVTNALLLTKDYESRLENLEKTHVIFEEKITKFMSMTKLLQTFAEAQEKENQKFEAKIEENTKDCLEIKEKTEIFQKNFQRAEGKIEALANNFEKLSEKDGFEDIIGHFRQEINKKIELVMLETQKSALNSDLEQLQAALDQEKHERQSILNEMIKDLETKEHNSQEVLGEILKKVQGLEESLLSKSPLSEGNVQQQTQDHYICSVKISKIEKELDDIKYSNHVTTNKVAKATNVKDLQTLEKSLVQQFTKGLDHFGEIIKKYVSSQKDLASRVKDLEKLCSREITAESPSFKELENPFLQNQEINNNNNHMKYMNNTLNNKENIAGLSNELRNEKLYQNKPTNFHTYLKNSAKIREESSSDLEDLLVKKHVKTKKAGRSIEKLPKKRSHSASHMKKTDNSKKSSKENTRSVKKTRKVSPETQGILKRISLERKEREKKIKEMEKKEKKEKKHTKKTNLI